MIVELKKYRIVMVGETHTNQLYHDIELEVRSYTYTAEVEVLEGEQKGKLFTVPSLCLNQ